MSSARLIELDSIHEEMDRKLKERRAAQGEAPAAQTSDAAQPVDEETLPATPEVPELEIPRLADYENMDDWFAEIDRRADEVNAHAARARRAENGTSNAAP